MKVVYQGDCQKLQKLKKELIPKVKMAPILRDELSKIEVDEEFHMFQLIQKVRARMSRKTGKPCYMYSSSILRQLREERAEGRFIYECIDRNKSIYKRIPGGFTNVD